MGSPITPTATPDSPEMKERTVEGNFRIYASEMQLLLYLRQQRNLLNGGETARVEVEFDQDHSHIVIVNLAQFRRIVLAS